MPLENLGYCLRRCFSFITFRYRHHNKSQLCKERGVRRSEKDRGTREGTWRKVEVRAPHEPRAGPALRVVLRYASRRPHPFCTHPPSPTPSSTSSSSSSSRRRSLLSSMGINLGRLHLYLMLPISRLIPSAYSLPPLAPPCFSLLSLLAERPTTRQDRARGTTRRTSLVHPVNPGRGRGEFIVPSVMDSHDAVRHRRLSRVRS